VFDRDNDSVRSRFIIAGRPVFLAMSGPKHLALGSRSNIDDSETFKAYRTGAWIWRGSGRFCSSGRERPFLNKSADAADLLPAPPD
jgi:hypothetical protein